MDVKYLGFSLEASSSVITVKDLMAEICKSSGESSNLKPIERKIYLNDDDDKYYKGLIITIKDQKKFCKLISSEDGFKIKVENLKGENKLMDFNFFVVNKENNIGLYQHYFQSCSLMVFGEYLKHSYRMIRDGRISKEIEKIKILNQGVVDYSEEKRVRKKYKSKLDFHALYRKEDIEVILKEFKKVKAFEYEYAYLTPEIIAATPLSSYVTKKKEKVIFSRGYSSATLATAISSALNRFSPKRGKVFVEDAEGIDSAIQIFNMPDCFGQEDYDDVANKLNSLDVNEFQDAEYINELIDICESEDYEHIFKSEIK
ncbi:hypothetical protein [Marinospirillum alkaliphilum]|uniref:Uncharacterized protein n=1 Tax=Marinospirillum alkaliphilum DSM 21637 TaxID=1122209 RepID=A0A1K1ZTH7_9GAMM|nr:hypothetical protein [Marinospirillum alkaliphilum]SFX77447.1 hypothetical protein SAMN02745752_02839 [Marinospirillum alkaliphilum DSM 21637]